MPFQMLPPKSTSRASPTTSSEPESDTVKVSRDPKPLDEQRALEAVRTDRLRNKSDKQDMKERFRYASNAYGITQAWIGFLMVLTMAQASLKGIGFGLSDSAFITVFTTTTASVFGFWALVGQYLFRKR